MPCQSQVRRKIWCVYIYGLVLKCYAYTHTQARARAHTHTHTHPFFLAVVVVMVVAAVAAAANTKISVRNIGSSSIWSSSSSSSSSTPTSQKILHSPSSQHWSLIRIPNTDTFSSLSKILLPPDKVERTPIWRTTITNYLHALRTIANYLHDC